jgi:hypothetical protein
MTSGPGTDVGTFWVSLARGGNFDDGAASSADCPRTAAAPPASSTKRENKKSAALLALDLALTHEMSAAT